MYCYDPILQKRWLSPKKMKGPAYDRRDLLQTELAELAFQLGAVRLLHLDSCHPFHRGRWNFRAKEFSAKMGTGWGGAGDGRADLRQCGSFFKFSFPRLSVAAGNHSLSVLFRGLFPALLIPFCQRRFQGDSHPLARSGSCGCLPLLLSDTQLVGNLIKSALITYVKTQRGTSSAPFRCSPYWLAAETFLLDSGLEEVSFPNSLTLFLVIIGSQVKPHLEQRRLALVFHLQLHWKWRLAQLGKKKIPIFPVFQGREEILDAVVKVDPALGIFWQLSRGHLLSKSIRSADHLKEGESHLVFSVSVTCSHLF